MSEAVSPFFSNLASELGARRRRMRSVFGDRGQGLVEFLIMGGLIVGSLGLLLAPWMPPAAPWGFAIPVVFFAGFFLLEWRRQKAIGAGADPTAIGPGYDWAAVTFGLACAVAGAAAFVIAWGAKPVPPEEDYWTPPESSVPVDIAP